MKKHVLKTTALVTLGFTLLSFGMKTKTYTYVDGNNNDYIITKSAIKYKPITKAESSSGTYSGGEPKKAAITKQQFEKIKELMSAIENDNMNIIKNREMGCGTLIIGSKTIYFNATSPTKANLEQELKVILFGI